MDLMHSEMNGPVVVGILSTICPFYWVSFMITHVTMVNKPHCQYKPSALYIVLGVVAIRRGFINTCTREPTG